MNISTNKHLSKKKSKTPIGTTTRRANPTPYDYILVYILDS